MKTCIERCLCGILDSLGLAGKYLTNQRVRGYEVDVLFPEYKIIMEADGEPYHQGEAMRRDRIRDQELFALGYRVIRFWGTDLVRAPWRVRRKLVVRLCGGPLRLRGLTKSERILLADVMRRRGVRDA
ncbi:MAG: DUF559 domain-containing protein [Thermoplasmata archaeon]